MKFLLFILVVKAYTIVTTFDFNIVVYDNSDIVSNNIRNNIEWEPHYLREIDKLSIKNKRYFLDIGANIGWLSLYALSKGWNVIAFEPMRENYEMIKLSISLNPGFKERIHIYPFGLSDKNLTCSISSSVNYGNGNLECDENSRLLNRRNGHQIREIVKLVTLDSLQLPTFDLIKIDIEGFEPKVFKGDQRFFSLHNEIPLLMEFGPSIIRDQGENPISFLQSLPYEKVILYDKNKKLLNLNSSIDYIMEKYDIKDGLIDMKLFNGQIDLSEFENRIYSRNNEDGITETLINLLNIKNGYYVEFNTKKQCNTRILREMYNWTGLLFDEFDSDIKINFHQEKVTAENINLLLSKYNAPNNFDFLSIDVGYNDLYIWKAILDRPKIVIIKYNPTHSPFQQKVVVYDSHAYWDGSDYFGASIKSIYKVGRQKGYSLVYAENEGYSLFFVLDELASLINNSDTNRIEKLYDTNYIEYRKDPQNRKYVN